MFYPPINSGRFISWTWCAVIFCPALLQLLNCFLLVHFPIIPAHMTPGDNIFPSTRVNEQDQHFIPQNRAKEVNCCYLIAVWVVSSCFANSPIPYHVLSWPKSFLHVWIQATFFLWQLLQSPSHWSQVSSSLSCAVGFLIFGALSTLILG